MADDLYSIFTNDLLYDPLLDESRILKLRFVHYLSSDEIHSHSGSLAEHQNRMSSLSLPLLKACIAALANIE